MTNSQDSLAKLLAKLEKRLDALERVNHLNKSTVAIPVADDVAINLGVGAGLFTGVEASADALTALDVAHAATKTYRQDAPPDPLNVDTGAIPEGAIWFDTDAKNKPYRWEAGTWNEVPLGQYALDDDLLALIRMRFSTEAQRDALLVPEEGMKAWVGATNLDYQYSSGVWVPLLQYIKKPSNTLVTNSTVLIDDPDFQVPMVPGTYRVEAFLHMAGANTGGDLALTWTYSGTVLSGNRVARGMAVAETAGVAALGRWTGHYLTTVVKYGCERDDTTAVNEDILLRVSTPGVLKMRWAQETADPTATSISAASRLYISKMT